MGELAVVQRSQEVILVLATTTAYINDACSDGKTLEEGFSQNTFSRSGEGQEAHQNVRGRQYRFQSG